MNIAQAKEQMKQAVSIYLKKDKYGNYRIPVQRQRPLFLIGAPGIGKTAVVDQIAKELDIGLVSYSMTHHTRQSALGLPYITKRQYKDKTFDISEYTMSEIIASVYEVMTESKKEEGILFLDEINCVSETLAPSMLQFLQYKTFGRHRVPEGWVIVTAGNPQEFNRSVRDFDVVTLDRMKVLEVEPSYPIWRDYAINRGVHKAILSYLDVKKQDFYLIETTVDGRNYVTARGWEDLSDAMYLNEECGYPVDETLIGQFLRHKRIARDFAGYYDLYQKYRQDYQVEEILSGNATKSILTRAKNAPFDERLSLMGLLIEAVQHEIDDNVETENVLRQLFTVLKEIKGRLADEASQNTTPGGAAGIPAADYPADSPAAVHPAENPAAVHPAENPAAVHPAENRMMHLLTETVQRTKSRMEQKQAANSLSREEKNGCQFIITTLTNLMHELKRRNITAPEEAFAYLKQDFDAQVSQMREQSACILQKLHHLFAFVVQTFGDGNELLVLVTELTVNYNSAKFIAQNGCDDYYKYNRKFMLHERNAQLLHELEQLEAQDWNVDGQAPASSGER